VISRIIEIERNDSLRDVSALSVVTEYGQLDMRSNPVLEHVPPLSMAVVDFSITLEDNPSIVDLTGWEGVTVFDAVFIDELHGLTSLEGLNATTIGSLTLWDNTSLVDLSGLRATTIERGLNLTDNDGLQSLAGAESLRTLGSLAIYNHPNLVELDGLFPLEEVSGDVIVGNNDAVTRAEANALIANIETIGGTVDLYW
jgi:hypothetical protein